MNRITPAVWEDDEGSEDMPLGEVDMSSVHSVDSAGLANFGRTPISVRLVFGCLKCAHCHCVL